MEYEKMIIWVPKDAYEVKIISKLKDNSMEEKIYDEEKIKQHKVSPFFDKLP